MQKSKPSETQAYALMSACYDAYMSGWKGKRGEKTAPQLIGEPEGTSRALLRKGFVEESSSRRARGRRYLLTKEGILAGEAVFFKFRGEPHPRERYLDAEKERVEQERTKKQQRERVATALAGLKLPRIGWQGAKEKPLDLSKEIRSGVFPQLDIDDLDAIIKHLT